MNGPLQADRIEFLNVFGLQLVLTKCRTLAIDPSAQGPRWRIVRPVVGRYIAIPFATILGLDLDIFTQGLKH